MSTLVSAVKTPGIFISMSIRAFINVLAFTLFVVKARLDLPERISLSLVCSKKSFLILCVLIEALKTINTVELEWTRLGITLASSWRRCPLYDMPWITLFIWHVHFYIVTLKSIIYATYPFKCHLPYTRFLLFVLQIRLCINCIWDGILVFFKNFQKPSCIKDICTGVTFSLFSASSSFLEDQDQVIGFFSISFNPVVLKWPLSDALKLLTPPLSWHSPPGMKGILLHYKNHSTGFLLSLEVAVTR